MARYQDKPETQKEQMAEVWDTLIGVNGGGLVERFGVHVTEDSDVHRKFEDKLLAMGADVQFIKGKLEGQTEAVKPDRKAINRQRFKETFFAAVVIGLFILVGMGAIKIGDIIEAIRAWRGT